MLTRIGASAIPEPVLDRLAITTTVALLIQRRHTIQTVAVAHREVPITLATVLTVVQRQAMATMHVLVKTAAEVITTIIHLLPVVAARAHQMARRAIAHQATAAAQAAITTLVPVKTAAAAAIRHHRRIIAAVAVPALQAIRPHRISHSRGVVMIHRLTIAGVTIATASQVIQPLHKAAHLITVAEAGEVEAIVVAPLQVVAVAHADHANNNFS